MAKTTTVLRSELTDGAKLLIRLFRRSSWLVKRNLQHQLHVPVPLYPLITGFTVPLPSLFNAVNRAANFPTCGVHVLWLPADAGKSCVLRAVGRQAQQSDVFSGALYYDNLHHIRTPMPATIHDRLLLAMGLYEHGHDFNVFLPAQKRALLIIDQVDNLVMGLHSKKELEAFVVSLAEKSLHDKKYVALLGVRDVRLAHDVLNWNGRQKIRAILPSSRDVAHFKWSKEHMTMLYEHLVKCGQLSHKVHQRNAILDLCAASGKPGFMLRNIYDDHFGLHPESQEDVKAHAKEWEEGTKMIRP
eukprot:m.234089 g.234089  ORF g.234089 m.234089 type:complete len:301 (+) comp19419_c0_seq1:351-1253(+)